MGLGAPRKGGARAGGRAAGARSFLRVSGFLLARRMHARGGRTGSAEGRAGGDAGQRRRGGGGPGGGGGGERGPRGRACLGPAARSCVQYVCLGGRPRASVRRGPRGPAQLRDCRSRSAPARLVPAGSCARPSDVNGGNGGCRRGFGLSQAESVAGRGREGPRRGSTGGGGPRGGGWGGRALAGPGPPRPEPGEWAGASGAGRVTSRRAAPPPVPRPVLSRAARLPDGSENAPRPPQPTLTPAASRDPKCQRPETCPRGWRRCGQVQTRGTGAGLGRAEGVGTGPQAGPVTPPEPQLRLSTWLARWRHKTEIFP